MLVLLWSACGGHPHYTLNAPPANASPFVRMQAFEQLRPAGRGELLLCRGSACTSGDDYLVLRDGREIWNFEDLAPVVEPTSRAGASMRDLSQALNRRRLWRNVLLVGLLGGVVIAYAGDAAGSHAVAVTGLAIAGGGVFVEGIGVFVTGMDAAIAKRSLVDQYEDGLARRLNICTKGKSMILVPCEAPNLPTRLPEQL